VNQLSYLARRLDYETTLTPMAMVDGELMPLSEAEAFHGWQEPELSFRSDASLSPRVKGEVKGLVGDNHGCGTFALRIPRATYRSTPALLGIFPALRIWTRPTSST
jgi:hypothetical protein